MLIYALRWRPSWISDRHEKRKRCRGLYNDHSWEVWFQLSKWFHRRSVLKHFPHRSKDKLSPAVAAILNFISEQKPKVCRGPSN